MMKLVVMPLLLLGSVVFAAKNIDGYFRSPKSWKLSSEDKDSNGHSQVFEIRKQAVAIVLFKPNQDSTKLTELKEKFLRQGYTTVKSTNCFERLEPQGFTRSCINGRDLIMATISWTDAAAEKQLIQDLRKSIP